MSDDTDDWIDQQLQAGPLKGREVLCPRCQEDWHGQPRIGYDGSVICDFEGEGVMTEPKPQSPLGGWGAF
jgi:hypothetical protein